LLLLVLLLDHCLSKRKRPTLKVQRSMSKSEISARISWPLAFTLIAFILAIAVVIIFLRVETWPARTARQSALELERVGKDLRAAFIDIAHLQPRITINNRVYMEQTTPVSELVVLSRRFQIEHEFLHTWVGSSACQTAWHVHCQAGSDPRNLSTIFALAKFCSAATLNSAWFRRSADVLAFENGFGTEFPGRPPAGVGLLQFPVPIESGRPPKR
jgi:hypothetical protein